MVVSQFESEYFVQDIPPVVIAGISDAVAVKVQIAGKTLDLTYFPFNGEAVIRDLSETVEKFMRAVDSASLVYDANGTATIEAGKVLTVHIECGGQSEDLQTFVRFSTMHTSMSSEGVILSRYAERVYDVDDYIYLSYLVASPSVQMAARLICIGVENDTYHDVMFTNSYSGTRYLRTYKLTAAMLASRAGVDVKKIMKIIFYVKASSGAVDSLECNVNHNGRRGKTVFVYDSSFGVPESVSFLGKAEEKEKHEAEIVKTGDGFLASSECAPAEVTVESGAMSEMKYYSALDMLRSEHVYVCEGGELKRVAIKSFDNFKQSPRYSCLSGTVTYVMSDAVRTVARSERAESNLFDVKFDKAFD